MKATPIVVRNVRYPSRRACCKALGVCYRTLREAEKIKDKSRGLDLVGLYDENGRKRKRGYLTRCNDKTYMSMAEFAREVGVNPQTIANNLDDCKPLERMLNKSRRKLGKPIRFYNKLFPSRTLLAETLGIPLGTLYYYIDKNEVTRLAEKHWGQYQLNLKKLNWKRDIASAWGNA